MENTLSTNSNIFITNENKSKGFFKTISVFKDKPLTEREQSVLNIAKTIANDFETSINTKTSSNGYITILENSRKDLIILFEEHTKTIKISKNQFIQDIKMSDNLCSKIKSVIKDESTKRFEEALEKIDKKFIFNLAEIEENLLKP